MHPMYKLYYREKGARFPSQLLNVDHFTLDTLPRGSIFHQVAEEGVPELDSALPYYQGYAKRKIVTFVREYTQPEGPLRKAPIMIENVIKDWKRKHLKDWQVEEAGWTMTQNMEQLVVVHYGYLDMAYRYNNVQMASYYQWKNRYVTLLDTVKQVAQSSDRHQFLFMSVPEGLLGRTILDKYAPQATSLQMVNVIGSIGMEGFVLLDLWRWLSVKHRKQSFLAQFTEDELVKINFIFRSTKGKQVLVNLAYLNAWIKGQTAHPSLGQVPQFSVENIEKFFLVMTMRLNMVLMQEEEPAVEEVTETPQDAMTAPQDDVDSEEASAAQVGKTVTPTLLAQKEKTPPLTTDKDLEALEKLTSQDYTKTLLDELEKDTAALDVISLVQLKNKGVLKKDAVQAETSQDEGIPEYQASIDPEEVRKQVYGSSTPSEALRRKLESHAEVDLITAADYRKMAQAVETFNQSKDPYGSEQTRKDAALIEPSLLVITENQAAIPISEGVPDKTMGQSTLNVYDRHYLKEVLRKDVLNAVDSLQAVGVVVKNHEITVAHSVLGTYETHRLELKPIDGAPSVVSFTLPTVEKDGTFSAGGNRYLMRKQRVDLPIRKIAPSIVALSTYYGKTFVQLSQKVANSSVSWLHRQINLSIVTEGSYIHAVSPGAVYDSEFKAPFIYNAIATEFEKLSAGDYQFNFNHHTRKQLMDPVNLALIEKDGRVFCGQYKKRPIVVDRRDHFLVLDGEKEQDLGNIYQVLQLSEEKAPIDFSEIRIFSKYIPVGVVLGYYLGLKPLCALLQADYRTVPARKNKALQPHEFAITFKDQSYVFSKTNRIASMVLAGFLDYDKVTKSYESSLFENKDVYLNLLMSKSMGSIYVRELDMMENGFVDPISRDILQSMQEPVTFKGLLVRATELLQIYHHPLSQDREAMRDRGYERFAGTVYKELTQAVRQFRNKNLLGRSKVDMSPYTVWNGIMKDNSLKIVEDINPIQNLKEKEVITFAGEGGRNKDTMTKPTRAFHIHDVGMLSESTVDSSAVGTIAYLSADPNLQDVRGVMKRDKTLNPTTMLSTAALVSPASTTDNPKRIMFINTQHSHTIASSAYRQPHLRTGYELVLGKRTGKLFSTAAEEDGVVESIGPKGMVVVYASGEKDGIPLGRQYGKAEGSVYPHDLTSSLQVGMKFKKGDILAYNSKFFEPDFKNPKEVCLKINTPATVAFIECPQTHEDSSTLSPKLSAKLQTEVVKIKSFTVNFQQNLLEVKKPGEVVEPRDILMIIEDEITANSGQFSETSLNALKRLSNIAPRANLHGKVEKIELFYHGDKRDMSPSLKKLADRSDQDLAEMLKSSGRPVVTGRVTEEYRVSGTPLELDKAEIRFYLSVQAGTGVGDKLVFGHQMKSTVAEVHKGEVFTESGQEVDAVFSYGSVSRRGVLSPALLGTTIRLLEEIGQRAVNLYYGE